MLTDWINVTRVTIRGAERLYPKGIAWDLTPGVNAIVGGTGLGKTIFMYAVQFAIFGKLVIKDDRVEKDFFKGRLTKRTGEDLARNLPCVHVEFKVGMTPFVIERNLLTGALVTATCNGEVLKGTQLEQAIATCVGFGKTNGGFALTELQRSRAQMCTEMRARAADRIRRVWCFNGAVHRCARRYGGAGMAAHKGLAASTEPCTGVHGDTARRRK